MYRLYRKNIYQGFTLIELLLVISIIALLASIILAALNVSKARAQDVKKIAETNSVQTAVGSYILDHNVAPPNYNCSGSSCVITLQRTTPEVEDTSNPTNPTTESGKAYNATMTLLVQNNYLASIPHSPNSTSYEYYNFPAGTISTQATQIFGSTLTTETAQAAGNNCQLTNPCPRDLYPDFIDHLCVEEDAPALELCDQYTTASYCECSSY